VAEVDARVQHRQRGAAGRRVGLGVDGVVVGAPALDRVDVAHLVLLVELGVVGLVEQLEGRVGLGVVDPGQGLVHLVPGRRDGDPGVDLETHLLGLLLQVAAEGRVQEDLDVGERGADLAGGLQAAAVGQRRVDVHVAVDAHAEGEPAVGRSRIGCLRGRGLEQVTLYVDDSNQAAVKLYRKLGFSSWAIDVCYAR
jgi:hypothetical protein